MKLIKPIAVCASLIVTLQTLSMEENNPLLNKQVVNYSSSSSMNQNQISSTSSHINAIQFATPSNDRIKDIEAVLNAENKDEVALTQYTNALRKKHTIHFLGTAIKIKATAALAPYIKAGVPLDTVVDSDYPMNMAILTDYKEGHQRIL